MKRKDARKVIRGVIDDISRHAENKDYKGILLVNNDTDKAFVLKGESLNVFVATLLAMDVLLSDSNDEGVDIWIETLPMTAIAIAMDPDYESMFDHD